MLPKVIAVALAIYFLLNCTVLAITLEGHATIDNRKGRIGILYDPAGHRVVKVYRNTPAHRAGIKKHDKVIYVDDEDIKGPAGTVVQLIIDRKSHILVFNIERCPIEEVDEHYEVKDEQL